MIDEKAFVDDAALSYASWRGTMEGWFDKQFRKYSDLDENDQDRIVREVGARIHAGDATVAAMQKTVTDQLVAVIGLLDHDRFEETLAGVRELARDCPTCPDRHGRRPA